MSTSEFNIAISQDKIVDLLMHAATREDIAKLDAKIDSEIGKLDVKIEKLDAKIEKLEAKIEFEATKFDAKINTKVGELDAKIDKLDIKLDKLANKYDKIVWFIIVTILVPIILHFMK